MKYFFVLFQKTEFNNGNFVIFVLKSTKR